MEKIVLGMAAVSAMTAFGWPAGTPQPNKYVLPPASADVVKEAMAARERFGGKVEPARFLGHRGDADVAPENTVAAFEAAERGGFGIETDLWLSRDGVVFLTHDCKTHCLGCDTWKDTTNFVWKGVLDRCEREAAGGGDAWKRLPYPPLERVLAFAGRVPMLMLHVCDSRHDLILPKIKAALARFPNATPSNTIVQVNAPATLKRHLPGWHDLACVLPRKGWEITAEPAYTGWLDGLDPAVSAWVGVRWDEELVTKEFFDRRRAKGLKTTVWTVNDAASAWAALGRGADMICTDRPTALLKEMRAFSAEPSVASEWRDDLWLGRGGFWTGRVPVAVENPSGVALEGATVSVPMAKLPLAGVNVEELRLVDARGVQLEYGVWTRGGTKLVSEGPVPKDGLFAIPVVCEAKGRARYEIYYGNKSAWGLADFWAKRPGGFVNGGFEHLIDDAPAGWCANGGDARHRLAVVGDAKEGTRCIRAEADANAEKSWFSYSQSGIPVSPGQKIKLRVMLRGENVKGYAGWYVHAGNAKKEDVLNKVFNGGTGTFAWKPLEKEVTIPEGCHSMTMGSVLWGTGRAWYDDLKVEFGTAATAPVATVGAAERLSVRTIGEDAAWLDPKWQYRVPVRLANFTDADVQNALASFPLPEVLHATRNPEYALTLNGKTLKSCALGERLLFTCSLPAKSVTTCYAYVRAGTGATKEDDASAADAKSVFGSQIPSDQVLVKRVTVGDDGAFAAILEGAGNLVRNGSFENGEDGWNRHGSKGVGFSLASGGRFGGTFAKMEIPVGVKANWSGRTQTVAVKPGRSYFYGAFIGGDNLESSATVHVHQHTAKGNLSSGGMQSARRGVSGTAPWTPVFGTLRAARDTAKVSLHLTMNGAGTVAHDGVLLTEYVVAKTGDPEFAPATETGAALKVAQVDPVVKVFRETPVEEKGGAFAVALAKNETEPLQLAVRSAKGGNVAVKVEGIPLACEVGRVDSVPVDWPTSYYSCTTPEWELRYPRNGGSSDGWSGWWPDPIVPVDGGTLVPNRTQAFWINFKADAATKPGVYRGRVVWALDGKTIRTDALEVKVWNFELPARPRFAAVYDLRVGKQWQSLGATPAERREALWAFMAEKKACPDTLGGDVKFSKDANGNVTADFTAYDKLAARYFDHYGFRHSYTPGCFYCFGWAMPPKKFLGEDPYPGTWPYEGADWTKLRAEYKKAYQQALKLYWDHVKAKGWADRITLYISDEPHFHHTNVVEQMKACCDMIHEVDRSIRIYSSTWRHCPAWNGFIDVWGAGHYGCFPVEELERRKAAGDRIWWTTDGQMCTDTPYCAVERMLPHYAHKYGADLYEFWGSTWLTYDPWKFGWHAYIRQSDTPGKTYWVRYPAGDGYLIYPPKEGMPAKPVSTIRMEASRDGVEDYGYLELLAERAKRDPKARELLEKFRRLVTIPNAGGRYSTRILPDPERIGRLRRQAGEMLSR